MILKGFWLYEGGDIFTYYQHILKKEINLEEKN